MRVSFDILADNDGQKCDRCKRNEWARIAMTFTPSLSDTVEIDFPKDEVKQAVSNRMVRVVLCIDCLSHAIQVVTGWDFRALINRYRKVSPDYITPVNELDTDRITREIDELAKPYRRLRDASTNKKGKARNAKKSIRK